MTYHHQSGPSAPPLRMRGDEDDRPKPPKRADIQQHPQERAPPVPDRDDIPATRPLTNSGLRRTDNEGNIENANDTGTCNYNRYATKKTIGHILLVVAIIMSNIMQLRTLIIQKQHDTIWTVSLVLVCFSILLDIGLCILLYFIAKDDIRNSLKETKLERFNNASLLIIIFLALINIVINGLMLTINPKCFLDTHSLELLQRQN